MNTVTLNSERILIHEDTPAVERIKAEVYGNLERVKQLNDLYEFTSEKELKYLQANILEIVRGKVAASNKELAKLSATFDLLSMPGLKIAPEVKHLQEVVQASINTPISFKYLEHAGQWRVNDQALEKDLDRYRKYAEHEYQFKRLAAAEALCEYLNSEPWGEFNQRQWLEVKMIEWKPGGTGRVAVPSWRFVMAPENGFRI